MRDRWNLLQAKFKRMLREALQRSGNDCELSEKGALIEVLCEQEDSFSTKEKKSLTIKRQLKKSEKSDGTHGLEKKTSESAAGGATKTRRSSGNAVEFLKEKAESELFIRTQELELQKQEQESRARQQEQQFELFRKQAEQQVQISQALMIMMQNLAKK